MRHITVNELDLLIDDVFGNKASDQFAKEMREPYELASQSGELLRVVAAAIETARDAGTRATEVVIPSIFAIGLLVGERIADPSKIRGKAIKKTRQRS